MKKTLLNFLPPQRNQGKNSKAKQRKSGQTEKTKSCLLKKKVKEWKID